MKYVAAYLLAHLGAAGDEEERSRRSPGKDDVRRILDAVGAEVEDERLDLLFSQLGGKDVAELLAAGREMLAYAPSGSVAAAVAVAVPGASAVEVKEEGKKKEVEEDSDGEEMVFMCDLFS